MTVKEKKKLPKDVKKLSLPTKNAKIQRKNRETADDPVVSRLFASGGVTTVAGTRLVVIGTVEFVENAARHGFDTVRSKGVF